jgi:hypothetical protein
MKDLSLFDITHSRVSLNFAGSVSDIDKETKKIYGLDRATSKSISLTDQVFSPAATAPSTRFTNSSTHPMDDTFNLLKSFHEANSNVTNRKSSPKLNGKLDMINNIALVTVFPDSVHSEHSIMDIVDLLKGIFKFNCSSGKPAYKLDPINDVAAKTFGSARFSVDPSHTQAEWIQLIGRVLGTDPSSVTCTPSPNSFNDSVAKSFGFEPPSAVALANVQTKLLDATYQLNYKLTPGSAEYKIKAEEIEQLKGMRQKLQNNLNEFNGFSCL